MAWERPRAHCHGWHEWVSAPASPNSYHPLLLGFLSSKASHLLLGGWGVSLWPGERGKRVRFQTPPCPRRVTLGIALASLALPCGLTTLPAQLLNHSRAQQALRVALECAEWVRITWSACRKMWLLGLVPRDLMPWMYPRSVPLACLLEHQCASDPLLWVCRALIPTALGSYCPRSVEEGVASRS